MKLPKKITPDSILEAVVEVRFASNFPSELLLGIIVDAFDDSYTYTDRPLKPVPQLPQNLVSSRQQVRIQVGTQSLLYNDKIIIQILPNSFVFTCLNKYVGWSEYQPEIKKCVG